MLKGRKSTRPEIKVIGARPMNDSPFVFDSLTRNLQSPTDAQEKYNIPSNGFDCIITRTSTLPGRRNQDKKERPKSEIFNGFNSLRAARLTNGEHGHLQKETKRVVRSKSLHAPKKPPRDFSMRPTSTSPCGEIKEEKLSVDHQSTHFTPARPAPTRPAPPAPSATANKRNQTSSDSTATSIDVPPQMEEKKVRNKRNRSKSTSTFSDSQKPRSKVALPRGKSFNTHGTRQMIKSTQDENVVILTRTSSFDEGLETNVKLKSFGVKGSRPSNNAFPKETASTSNETKVLNESNGLASSDKLGQIETENFNGKKAEDGHISLSDAIHANPVYTRLQQKNEEETDTTEVEDPSREDNDGSVTNGVTLTDSTNPDTVLKQTGKDLKENTLDLPEVDQNVEINRVANEGQIERDEEKLLQNTKKEQSNDKDTDIDWIKNENRPLQESLEVKQLQTEKHSFKSESLEPVKPVARYIVKNGGVSCQSKGNTHLIAGGRSMSLDGDYKRGSPPAVKPKPRVPKRPSMEKIVLRPLDSMETVEEFSTSTADAKSDPSTPVLSSKICTIESPTNISDSTVKGECNMTSDKISEKIVEERSEKAIAQEDNSSYKILKNNAIDISKDRKCEGGDEDLAEKFNKTDIDSTLRSKINSRDVSESEESQIDHSSSTGNTIVENPNEDDVFLDNSTIPRNKSESEAESAGSVDSLTSLTSQVTVICNLETTKPLVTDNKAIPGPFEPHQTNKRRKPIPEPYSSHPERRPKPAKATPNSWTTKSKTRKSKSLYGRRLNSSPPSTPPPPPKIDNSESSPSIEKIKNRPPVPPRAPSMYIQKDNISLNNSSQVKAPPPRPSKPPILVSSDLEKDDSIDMNHQRNATNSVSGKAPLTQDSSAMDGECDAKLPSNNVSNGFSNHNGAAGVLAEIDLRPQTTNTTNSQSSKEFSRKLEYFKDAIDKPKKAHTIFKQRSLDSYHEKVSAAQTELQPSNAAQLRKEGEEALRIVSQLRKENGEILINKKKSPAPQKPKRPSSVNMDSVVLFDFSEVKRDTDINTKLSGCKAPPKPERSPSVRKSDLFEGSSAQPNNTKAGRNEQIPEEISPDVELRSKDSEIFGNLKPIDGRKVVPKKPVRTSSLRRKDPGPVKVDVKKEPAVNVVDEEGLKNRSKDAGFNLKGSTNSACRKDNMIGARLDIEVTTSGANLNSMTKVSEKDEGRPDDEALESETLEGLAEAKTGCSQEFSGMAKVMPDAKAMGCGIDGTRGLNREVESENDDNNGCQPQVMNGENCNTHSDKETNSSEIINTDSHGDIMPEALSTQIDQLDRILLETSTVLSEGLSDSVCSLHDSGDQSLPVVENNDQDSRIFNNGCLECSSPHDLQDDVDGSSISNQRRTKTSSESVMKQEEINANKGSKQDNGETVVNSMQENLNDGCHSIVPVGDIKRHNSLKEGDFGKSRSENSSAIDIKLSSQFGSGEKSDKSAPPKPSRPKSLQNINYHLNLQTDKAGRKVLDRPSKQPEIELVPENQTENVCRKTTTPLFMRANSAPEKSCIPYLPRKSRPPIPSILREKEAENSSNDNIDGRFTQNLRKDLTEPHGIALYDYIGENETDLSFKAGDVILLDKKINDNWYHGSVHEKKGMFPVNFLEIIKPLHTITEDLTKDDQLLLSEKPAALAIYPFVAGNENELTFDSGDTIELLSKHSEDWLVGRCNGREGSFPASFVAIIKPLEDESDCKELLVSKEQSFAIESSSDNDTTTRIESSSVGGPKKEVDKSSDVPDAECTCTAVADFPGGSDGDLPFKCGQEIRIISPVNEEWLKGTLEERTGIFPKSFVKIHN